MAAFDTRTERFTELYNALLKSDGGMLNLLNDSALVPDGARAGAVTARVTTAVTLQDVTDGTMASNNAARTEVSLTAFEKQHPISLHSYELAQFDGDSEIKEVRQFVSAARVMGEGEVIADFVAGTPGATETLPAGQIDFATDGTDGEAYTTINALDAAIGYVEANTQGDPDAANRTFIVTTKTGWSNLKSLRGVSRLSRYFDKQNGRWYYDGYPIFISTVSTNFGGASKAAAFVAHGDAEALVWEEMEMPHDDFRHYGDGMWKLFMKCYGFAGLIQATHYAEVANPSS